MNRTRQTGRKAGSGWVNRCYQATAALSACALLTACGAAAEYRGASVYGGTDNSRYSNSEYSDSQSSDWQYSDSQSGQADKAYYVMAPVRSTTPITVLREVERPVQHCTEYERDTRYHNHSAERREHRRERRTGPSLVGGLIGGLIGSQFGGGSGRKVLTVIGALAGSSIANGIDRERRRERDYDPPRRTCRTTYEYETVEEIEGYEVVYEYRGQEFVKTVSAPPGDRIRVRVELSPEVDG